MADSNLWRDFALAFQKLSKDYCDTSAQCRYQIGSDAVGEWALCGSYVVNVRFDALSRRAAVGLPNKRSSDLLIAWLEAIRVSGIDFELARPSLGDLEDDDEAGDATSSVGFIHGVCHASANLCKKLEAAALQAEFEGQGDPSRKSVQASPASPITETVGAQINHLREECHLTAEELAEEVELDSRTVQRHLADETTPYARHLRIYERVFSKLLNRPVVICKMP